ncbi:hypothetical protein ACOME3_008271 [Neoechinorhynchus agilis]
MTEQLEQVAECIELELSRHVDIFPPFCKIRRVGFWKTVIVKSTTSGKLSLIFSVEHSSSDDEVILIAEKLVGQLKMKCELHSAYITFDKNTERRSLRILHKSDEDLIETDFDAGKSFLMPPNSFFQPNIYAAKLLLDNLRKRICGSFDVDVCCGSGLWAISLSELFSRTIGVDNSKESIEIAHRNIELNGLSEDKVKFTVDTAEHFLPCLLNSAEKQRIVAIVDPPRAGLHTNALRAIRSCPSIHLLLYISCDFNQAKQDFLNLCKRESKKYAGIPFQLESLFAVDMFPHTNNVELCLSFVRQPCKDVRECVNIMMDTVCSTALS